jgi:hypothetical protein
MLAHMVYVQSKKSLTMIEVCLFRLCLVKEIFFSIVFL